VRRRRGVGGVWWRQGVGGVRRQLGLGGVLMMACGGRVEV
jgi:hypothetical protein